MELAAAVTVYKMAENLVTADEIVDMVTHWLQTMPNTFLGSDYGGVGIIKEILHKSMRSAVANSIIEKMKKDIPILSVMPSGMINIYMQDKAGRNDTKVLYIDVASNVITVDQNGVVI